jgi:tetratricopeptide (TPR) repeat protein
VNELHAAIHAAQVANDAPGLERVARQLIALGESSGDFREGAAGYYYLGRSFFWRNDARGAENAYRSALELFTSAHDEAGIARTTIGLAAVALDIELDLAKARTLYDRILPMVRQLGDGRLLAETLGNLAGVCRLEGDYVPAVRYMAESTRRFADLQLPARAAARAASLGHMHGLLREYEEAFDAMRQAYDYLHQETNPRTVAWYFDSWFTIAGMLGRWETAARLLGFVNRYRDEHNVMRLQGIIPDFAASIERISELLGERFHDLILEGEALTPEGAQAEAETLTNASKPQSNES